MKKREINIVMGEGAAMPLPVETNKELVTDTLVYLLQDAKVNNSGNEIICHCHNISCDDRSSSHGHLYIKVQDGTPLLYHCFKCNTSGIVNSQFIRDYLGYSPEEKLLVIIDSYNRNFDKRYFPKVSGLGGIRSYLNDIPIASSNDNDLSALHYISNRLGFAVTPEYVKNKRIIVSLASFLKLNGIYLARDKYNLAVAKTVGFLSDTGAMVNLRFIEPNQKYRYYKLNIYGNNIDTSYYIFSSNSSNTIDIGKDLHIYIGEGPFDVLGYENYLANTADGVPENSIFCAAGGKSYTAALSYILLKYNLGLNNIKLDIHYLLDREIDVNLVKYDYLSSKISSIYNMEVCYHKNVFDNEKDFGVPINRIKDMMLS